MPFLHNSFSIHRTTSFLNSASPHQLLGLHTLSCVPRCRRKGVSSFLVRVVHGQANCTSWRGCSKRELVLLGVGTLVANVFPTGFGIAKEILKDYRAFVDSADGYSYYYPSDWRDFDFRGHDSAFKDRYLQLQNVRLSFIPTNKTDIRDFGTMEEVVPDLVRHVYAAPNQTANIYDMQERTVDGKNYYTFEYELKSPNFSRTAFATIAIANGRYYTLIVGANERRWKRIRSKLKLVADSFRVFDI
ncbi:hypothetical protein Scep_001825 [Stephania cephalantha]|uniref:PsbP C-terminal domain-containing protein n=1 Tax=Stephania cephalantha TaxID=152367 RepID=A0AAP0LCR7_9MAGN